jgi:hypothetical protein
MAGLPPGPYDPTTRSIIFDDGSTGIQRMSLRGRLGGNEIVFRHSMIRPLMQEGKSYCIGFEE